jgi:two-component system chemotaxis response regulator CheY
MKTLIVEDDFTSRLLLQGLLQSYGPCHVAVNGNEAVQAARTAIAGKAPYNLICIDIMMPEMDGQTALKEIRALESEAGILSSDGSKIIMTTALDDKKNVMSAFREQCDAYMVKPIDRDTLVENLRSLRLIL